jgi:hypothetical protein
MSSVTKRIEQIKQPRGGFLRPTDMETINLNDGIILNENENIHSAIVGMTVDYLTRFINGKDRKKAFAISLRGADIASKYGPKNSYDVAIDLLESIDGLDDNSIVSACKLVTFDVWFRNMRVAPFSKTYIETMPDDATISNIRTMVKRSLSFIDKYGPITKDGFSFELANGDMNDYRKMVASGKGSWGGYTATVNTGDGDFLTNDTLWDFKVSSSELTSKHTLQLLMYWIMGQHSKQICYENIRKIGIFNPRFNKVYIFDINNLSAEVIEFIEKEVICY